MHQCINLSAIADATYSEGLASLALPRDHCDMLLDAIDAELSRLQVSRLYFACYIHHILSHCVIKCSLIEIALPGRKCYLKWNILTFSHLLFS